MTMQQIPKRMIISSISGLVIITIFIFIACLSHKQFEATIVSQTQQQLLELAKTAAHSLELFIAKHSEALKTIAQNPFLQEDVYKKVFHDKPDIGYCLIKTFYEVHKNDVDALTTLTTNGIMLHRHPFIANRPGMDHTDKPGVAYVVKEHKPHVSKVFYNNLGSLAISISEPVFYKDEFAGIVRWMIQTDTISKRFIQPIKAGKKGYAWLFDDKEVVLSHPEKEFVGMSVLEVIRKVHLERGETFDESRLKEHIREEHDYLNRVKVEDGGWGIFIDCRTDKNDLVAYKRVAVGDRKWGLIIVLPYSEIAGPINRHARNTFGLAGLIVLLFGTGGILLFRTQKKKTELETETKYLKEIAESAEAVRESEEKLSGIVDSITDCMTMVDKDFTIVWVNDVATRLFGQDLIGKKCYSAYRGRDKVCDPCMVKKCFKDGKTHDHETEVTSANGNKIAFWCTASVAARDEKGHPKRVVEICRDITERKRSEEELKTLNQQIEFILGATKTGIDIIDSEFNIRYIDSEWQKVYGDPTGRKCYQYFMDRSEVCPGCGIVKAMETKSPQVTEEVLVREGNRPIQVTTIPFQDSKGKWLFAEVNVDITERKLAEEEKEKMQAQLLHAQKMEAIGTMASGIAHDFNNRLTVMRGNAQLMAMDLNPDDPHRELLKEIEKQATLASTLTQQLLGFARGGKYEVKPINLNDVVRESSTAFGRTKKQIPIHLTLQEDLPPVEADAGQIEQVLMNLYVNAAYAMPARGDLYLETRAVTREEIKERPSHMESGSYVLLSVRDTGVGMDKETQERIFDPFFTTREMGRGTGLGLASVFGIIENHKGYIDVESEKGRGTTFKIYLPISKKDVTKSVKVADKVIKGTETILLIDDEEQVLKLSVRVLNTLGYTVLEARNGREAVDVYKKKKAKIDLVILDMIMPDMGGDKAYDLLKAVNPEIKILLCSGYSIDGEAMGMLEQGCDGFIQKPFDIKGLSHKIREILDEK